MFTTTIIRTAAVTTAVLGTFFAGAATASAHEPAPRTAQSAALTYADPIEALGGIPFAVYLALHQERVFGPIRG